MNEEWQTPLMAAASDGNVSRVKDLIENKANVNSASRGGMTALMYATGLPVVKSLLHAGASVNEKDMFGRTALHYASQRHDPEVVRALLDAGADVNAKDDRDMSPLQLATLQLRWANSDPALDILRKPTQEVVDLLVASGAKGGCPIVACEMSVGDKSPYHQ